MLTRNGYNVNMTAIFIKRGKIGKEENEVGKLCQMFKQYNTTHPSITRNLYLSTIAQVTFENANTFF